MTLARSTRTAGSARADWLEGLGLRAVRDRPAPSVLLPPPEHVVALLGRGHTTVDWSPVPDAAGYLIHRARSADGAFVPVDHGGGDLLAVPCGPCVDTTGQDGGPVWYAVELMPVRGGG